MLLDYLLVDDDDLSDPQREAMMEVQMQVGRFCDFHGHDTVIFVHSKISPNYD